MLSIDQMEMRTKMKTINRLLLILLMSGLFTRCFAQEDWQFVPDNFRFIESKVYLAQMSDPGSTNYYEYLVAGDTIIEGMNYQLVFTRNLRMYQYYNDSHFFPNDPYRKIGGIRKDISEKVYFRSFGIIPHAHLNAEPVNSCIPEEENLILDFSIEQGDTVHWKTSRKKVEYIDSLVLNNGQEAKRIVFLEIPRWHFGDDYWIEGIGNFRGLLGALTKYYNARGPFFYTICLNDMNLGVTLYNDPWFASTFCDEYEIPNEAETSGNLKIFPNPTQSNIKINFQNINTPVSALEIVNANGNTVYQEEISYQGNGTYEKRLNLALNPGFYVVLLKSESGQMFKKKLIVIK